MMSDIQARLLKIDTTSKNKSVRDLINKFEICALYLHERIPNSGKFINKNIVPVV